MSGKNLAKFALLIAAVSKEMCSKCPNAKVHKIYSCPDEHKEECVNCLDIQYNKVYGDKKTNGTDNGND